MGWPVISGWAASAKPPRGSAADGIAAGLAFDLALDFALEFDLAAALPLALLGASAVPVDLLPVAALDDWFFLGFWRSADLVRGATPGVPASVSGGGAGGLPALGCRRVRAMAGLWPDQRRGSMGPWQEVDV